MVGVYRLIVGLPVGYKGRYRMAPAVYGRSLPRYLCLLLPFLGILLCVKGVNTLHTWRYGISSLEYYATAMDEIAHIMSTIVAFDNRIEELKREVE